MTMRGAIDWKKSFRAGVRRAAGSMGVGEGADLGCGVPASWLRAVLHHRHFGPGDSTVRRSCAFSSIPGLWPVDASSALPDI